MADDFQYIINFQGRFDSIDTALQNLEKKGQASGKQAGDKFAQQFQSVFNTALGALSFSTLTNGIGNAVKAYSTIVQANSQIASATRQVNSEYAKNQAILNNSNSTLEQRAAALGINTDKLYTEEKATKTNSQAVSGLESQIKSQTRVQENQQKSLEAGIRGKERELAAITKSTTGIDQQISQIDRQVRGFEKRLSLQNQEENAISRQIQSVDNQTKAIDRQVSALQKQTAAKEQAIKKAGGNDALEIEQQRLAVQKNNLEIQRDTADLNNDPLSSLLISKQITDLNKIIQLNTNKREGIKLEVDAIKNQNQAQIEALNLQKDELASQKNNLSVQREAISVQRELIQAQKEEATSRKQDLQDQKQLILDQAKIVQEAITQLRQNIQDKQVQFDLDITPAKRKLEDLRAEIGLVNAQGTTTKVVNPDAEQAIKNAALPPPPPPEQIKAAADKLLKQYGDYISAGDLNSAFADVIKAGVTDLDQASNLVSGYVDAAANGKSASVGLGTALTNLTFGFRTGNSEIGNLSGVQENYSDIIRDGTAALKDKAIASGDVALKQRIESGLLTDADKIQTKYLGALKVTNDTRDQFNTTTATGVLEGDKFNLQMVTLTATLGKGFLPALNDLLKAITPFLEGLTKFTADNPNVVLAVTGTALALTGLVTAASGLASFIIAIETIGTLFAAGGALAFIVPVLTGITAAIGAAGLPILALGAIIVGAVAAYNTNFFGFRDTVNSVFKTVGDIWKALPQTFKEAFVLAMILFEQFTSFIGGQWQLVYSSFLAPFVNGFLNLGKSIGDALAGLAPVIRNGLGNALSFALLLINLTIDGANRLIDTIRGIPGAGSLPRFPNLPIPRFAQGGDFIVPPGFNRDNYLMGVQSGERVQVTPANQVTGSYNRSQTINYQNYGNTQRDFNSFALQNL